MREIQIVLLSLALSLPSTGQQAPEKGMFFAEKGCPLVSTLPVVGSGFEVKNVGQKTISSYKLACFRRGAKQPKVDLLFQESFESIPPNEVTGVYGFDDTPPNVCRSRKELLGVYEVKFSDGTSWKTAAGR
jgi:hypothetical protein